MDNKIFVTGIDPANPNHHLELMVEAEYMAARVIGSRTRVVVSSLVNEIAKAAIENRRDKVLIDVRNLEGWLGVFDSYFIVTKDFQRLRGKGISKAAIIDRPLPKVREIFFETVSRNRGFNLRIFDNPETALAWLLAPARA
jgi:hypothetical protein